MIMVSLVLVITHALNDDPRPYIVGVAMGANSGALMTFASGIPTLMVGTVARIPYWQFLVVSSPLALLSRDCLMVIGGPKQRTSTSYQRLQTLVRESCNPVLVV